MPHRFANFGTFRKLPYYEQWDALVAFVRAEGNRPILPAIIFHLVFFVVVSYLTPTPIITRRGQPCHVRWTVC